MYITETTDNVKNIFEQLQKLSDIGKLRFLLYTYGLLNNNQINNKNEKNPDLIEDDDLIIFNMQLLGLNNNQCTTFLQYLVMINNLINDKNKIYEDGANVIGIEFEDDELKVISMFEKLYFLEKLDVFSELFIKYDNDTYFENKIATLSWDKNLSGYDIAKIIQNVKKEII